MLRLCHGAAAHTHSQIELQWKMPHQSVDQLVQEVSLKPVQNKNFKSKDSAETLALTLSAPAGLLSGPIHLGQS